MLFIFLIVREARKKLTINKNLVDSIRNQIKKVKVSLPDGVKDLNISQDKIVPSIEGNLYTQQNYNFINSVKLGNHNGINIS